MIIDFRKEPNNIQPLTIKGEDVRIVNKYKYLGTTIDDKLNWSDNTDIICKKANQRLFFLRKLRQYKVSIPIKQLFYQSVIESTLLYNQVCYYGAAKKEDKERLDAITVSAAKIIGTPTRSLQEVYETNALKKLRRMDEDESHPLHPIVRDQHSKRATGRFLSLPSKTSRHADSLLPNAMRLMNAKSKR